MLLFVLYLLCITKLECVICCSALTGLQKLYWRNDTTTRLAVSGLIFTIGITIIADIV